MRLRLDPGERWKQSPFCASAAVYLEATSILTWCWFVALLFFFKSVLSLHSCIQACIWCMSLFMSPLSVSQDSKRSFKKLKAINTFFYQTVFKLLQILEAQKWCVFVFVFVCGSESSGLK